MCRDTKAFRASLDDPGYTQVVGLDGQLAPATICLSSDDMEYYDKPLYKQGLSQTQEGRVSSLASEAKSDVNSLWVMHLQKGHGG